MTKVKINDTELFYVTVGKGIPCLAMHGGLGFDHTSLHPWLDPLGDTLELTYYDHRGNGRSGRPDRSTLTHAQFAADAAALATNLGHDKVAVIGYSYGGFIALEFALRHPQRVSHLILLDTAPSFNYGDEIMENARKMGASDEVLAVAAEDWKTNEEMSTRFPIIWPLYFKKYDSERDLPLLENTILSIEGRTSPEEVAAYNVTPRLGEIKIPTLVLAGRVDFVCPPSQAQIMHEGISDSELVIFEESGHFPFIEEPELFYDTVRDWFKRTTS